MEKDAKQAHLEPTPMTKIRDEINTRLYYALGDIEPTDEKMVRAVNSLEILFQEELEKIEEDRKLGIGLLRQWLNEDRITDTKKMVTNEDIKRFLDIRQHKQGYDK